MARPPEWFISALSTGHSRLYAAKLAYPPSGDDEVAANLTTWAEALWPARQWRPDHVPAILRAFGLLVAEMRDFPTPADFWPRWDQVNRPRPDDVPRLPPPERSPAEQERIAAGRERYRRLMQVLGSQNRQDRIARVGRDVIRGLRSTVNRSQGGNR